MAATLAPRKVQYCGVCGLPPEYCEFGPDFNKCKPWLLENAPEVYPELQKQAEAEEKASEQLQGLAVGPSAASEESSKAGGSSSKKAAAGAGGPDGGEGAVQKLPGGKVKKKEKPSIVVEKVTRNKRKAITMIKGMELFGIKLSDASKKFGKKFASGASVVKGPTEKEQIDVQGDIMYDVVDFITETWPEIPETAIFFMEDGKKVPAME
eukprot:TRINITY_DN36836_c0_g1_i1.p2 TRINITY_DN36836_c0_g1~~TRINITY_DN36836_c0_g1_i1.p2  ORF type:complete len:209 (-),score=63.32 TRINITY_DN36836_c0_g1_i1:501-1127(-)